MTIDPKTLPDGVVVELISHSDRERQGWHLILNGRAVPWAREDRDNDKSAAGAYLRDLDPERVVRVFVPVPDGVAYDDALRAVNDARPWVEWEEGLRAPASGRVRGYLGGTTWVEGSVYVDPSDDDDSFRIVGIDNVFQRTPGNWFIHPDDVPDPDAAVKDRLRYVLEQAHLSIDALVDDVLAVIREDQP